MGTDVVVALVREVPSFSRVALRKTIVDLWLDRGAKALLSRWSQAAADRCWEHSGDDTLGYALSPTSDRGWVAIIESAHGSVRFDKALLSLLATRTTCWLHWACDHSGLYGSRRVSKGRTQDPLDFEYSSEPYAELQGRTGWEYLAFSGASWSTHRGFAITRRTTTHALPEPVPTVEERRTAAFLDAVGGLNVVRALTALADLRTIDDHLVDDVFAPWRRVEFVDVARFVVQVGGALIKRAQSPKASHWVRLLEMAAILNDQVTKDHALAELAKCPRVEIEFSDAISRFELAATVTRTAHDGRADMLPAQRRFLTWTKRFGR